MEFRASSRRLLHGLWRVPICFCPCIGTMNWFVLVLVVLLVLENVQTGWVVEDEDEDEEEDEWPGSWKVSIRFRTRIGTMNWFVLVLVVLLVLENVQTGWVAEDEDEEEEEDEWPVSWEILMLLFDRTFAPQTAAGRTLPRQCLGARQSSAVIGSAQRARRRNLALLFSDRSATAPAGRRSPNTGGI